MDQHVVTDWKEYFERLGPSRPFAGPFTTPMYVGEPRPSVHYAMGQHGDIVVLPNVSTGENLFDLAKEAWEANGSPEMWLFLSPGSPPWRVNAGPKASKVNRR